MMQGRFHRYEGYSLQQVTFPVRVLRALDAGRLVVSNVSGGLHPLWALGDLVLIADHVNLLGDNPLVGPNDEADGPRFPDMSAAYDPEFRALARAAALAQGVTLREGVYVAVPGPNLETRAEYRMLRTMGADVVGMSTVPEVIIYSSNIGAAKMAMAAGVEAHKAFFEKMGMFRRTSIELPEAGQPLFPSNWKPINTMTAAFGHGIAVTPLHLASAVAALINGGSLRPATLIARAPDEVFEGNPVVSEATSLSVRQLMRLVVETGTGRKAHVPGYLIGGKTAPAEKLQASHYSQNVIERDAREYVEADLAAALKPVMNGPAVDGEESDAGGIRLVWAA